MKYSQLLGIATMALFLASSCKQQQEARKPLSHSSGSFMKKSIVRNKKLIAGEEEQIQAIIKHNPKTKFLASTKGYWYSYATRNTLDSLTPKKGDVALFDYEVKDLKGHLIYSQTELSPQTYYVDKQDIMMGLRDGIKLMRKKEKVTFLFPSHIAYGYHGDSKKIGTNQPLLCVVTLRDFMDEKQFKKQTELQVTTALKKQPTTTNPTDSITQ
ncbi:gliding motility-associated peptidyl-prolyl isomerase GldI [Flavobacterium restrictum]|uniref:Peptidyl-prolyl cis-trans isomerase n=1 Tax=Flavobacterium restrictum TaxID=2594428 RepID=A0A553E402_9FLAO|nr:gliding motility-associated peptidyl-prolyl isomerase GldI [Flavobacterium restrictum]TRX39758.1 gliding motility-associated peptidyl-prolyl isomerase GldI [Flavobacterium restrictum]